MTVLARTMVVGSLVIAALALMSVAPPAIMSAASPGKSDGGLVSDFNGDGFADLAVGVPGEDVGTISAAGAVNVLYGSAGGLQADSPDDQFWHQDSPGAQDAAEPNDRFGSSLAAADFNGDGFADLAVGIPGEDVGSIDVAGAVQVLYGSAGGLQTGAPDDQFWNQDSPGIDDGAEDLDSFGSSLAAGDFNADGFADLAVGVPTEDLFSTVLRDNSGATNVLYGSTGGLQADSPDNQFWHQNSPGVQDVAEDGDFFGSSLVAGDFNRDGFADLAVGVFLEDVNSFSNAGATHVLYGSARGLQADSPDDQFWHQDSPGVQDAAEEGDNFGFSVAAGDLNADGFSDLAVGVPSEDLANARRVIPFAGAVTVLYGSAGGLQADSPDDQFWHQDSPGVQDIAQQDDNFGFSVAAGDLNRDGFVDLAVGVARENVDSLESAGAANVLYGSAEGLQADSPDDQFWHQDSPGVQDAAERNDRFGFSLDAGDFNGDGFTDLAVGVQLEELGGFFAAGAVSVLYGSPGGLQADSPDDQFWHQDNPGVKDAAEANDGFGNALAAGDL